MCRQTLIQSSFGAAVFITLLISTPGCKSSGAAEKEVSKALAVKVIPVERGTLVNRLGFTGDIEGEAEIRIYSPIPERVTVINVREGDRIKKGQVIAQVRAQALASSVRQATGGLDAARAQRVSLRDQRERMAKLRNSDAITSSQLLGVESQLAAAEAQVRQLEATVSQAQQRRGDAAIRAPISGTIGQVFVKAGDMALPQIPICTVVDMDRVRIKIRVPESDLVQLKVGQPAIYRMAVSNAKSFSAVVSRVSPVLDRLSRTATLEIDVVNAQHLLKPGMLARVEIEVERRENVIWAPKDALTITIESQGGKSFYRGVVADKNIARERLLLLGLEEGSRVEVLTGLAAGEKLIVEGQHLLAEGDPVRVVSAAPTEPATAPDAGNDR
jgi:RND family efflux transporter MFP subunit